MADKLDGTDALPKLEYADLDEPAIYGFGDLSAKIKRRKENKARHLSVFMVVITVLLAIAGMSCTFVFGMIANQYKVDAEQEKYFAENVHAVSTNNPDKAGSNAATYSDVINTKASSKLWLPYQLNEDPNTLYHEAIAGFCPSTHIYWVPLDERMFVIGLCKLKSLLSR